MTYSKKPRSSLRKKSSGLPNCHWNRSKQGSNRKQKLSYDTIEQANEFLSTNKLNENFIAYLCPYCNKFHIGHKKKSDKNIELSIDTSPPDT